MDLLNAENQNFAKTLSEHFDGIPIISVQDLWKDFKGKSEDDYIRSFSNLISQENYIHGFIVDGLDFFPEGVEHDLFLKQTFKQRNVFIDLKNNPFSVCPHNYLSASEKALSYILNSLKNHYVFFDFSFN